MKISDLVVRGCWAHLPAAIDCSGKSAALTQLMDTVSTMNPSPTMTGARATSTQTAVAGKAGSVANAGVASPATANGGSAATAGASGRVSAQGQAGVRAGQRPQEQLLWQAQLEAAVLPLAAAQVARVRW